MTSWMRLMLFAATLATLVGSPSLAQGPVQGKAKAQPKPQPAAEELTGLKVGEKAPKFTLKDQEGRERSLDDLLKKGKVALVFTRSADW